METYLPYADFEKSAQVLFDLELLDSIVCSLRVFEVVHEVQTSDVDLDLWGRHPVVHMWRGHTPMLYQYASTLVTELRTRPNGKAADGLVPDTYMKKFDEHLEWATSGEYTLDPPWWVADPVLHSAHQADLFRRNPNAYGPIFPDADPSIPMRWPVD